MLLRTQCSTPSPKVEHMAELAAKQCLYQEWEMHWHVPTQTAHQSRLGAGNLSTQKLGSRQTYLL